MNPSTDVCLHHGITAEVTESPRDFLSMQQHTLSLSFLYCRYKDCADDERMQTPEDSIELLYADGVPELGTSRSVAADSTGRLNTGKKSGRQIERQGER